MWRAWPSVAPLSVTCRSLRGAASLVAALPRFAVCLVSPLVASCPTLFVWSAHASPSFAKGESTTPQKGGKPGKGGANAIADSDDSD